MLRILPLYLGVGTPPWSYFELRRLPLFRTNHAMSAVSAQEGSLSSKRSWNLKAELSFIFLNARSAEIALGPTKARSSAALVLLKVRTLPRRLRIPSRFPSPVSHSEKISNRYEIVIRNIAAVGVLWIARAADGWGGFLFRIRRANVRASPATS